MGCCSRQSYQQAPECAGVGEAGAQGVVDGRRRHASAEPQLRVGSWADSAQSDRSSSWRSESVAGGHAGRRASECRDGWRDMGIDAVDDSLSGFKVDSTVQWVAVQDLCPPVGRSPQVPVAGSHQLCSGSGSSNAGMGQSVSVRGEIGLSSEQPARNRNRKSAEGSLSLCGQMGRVQYV